MNLILEHTEKPQAKLCLANESAEVKILCSLWKQLKIVNGILYRVSKTERDPKTNTKKPLFYLDNIFNNLLIFNMVLRN